MQGNWSERKRDKYKEREREGGKESGRYTIHEMHFNYCHEAFTPSLYYILSCQDLKSLYALLFHSLLLRFSSIPAVSLCIIQPAAERATLPLQVRQGTAFSLLADE